MGPACRRSSPPPTPPPCLSSGLRSGWMLLFRCRRQCVLVLPFAQTHVAFEGSHVCQTQVVTQGFQRSSRLQIADRKGVAQHRGTHRLVGDPRPLAEPIKHLRDSILCQRLIRLREEEQLLLSRFFRRPFLWTMVLQIGEQLVYCLPALTLERVLEIAKNKEAVKILSVCLLFC